MLRDAMELYNPPLPINWRTAYRLWQRIYSRLLYQARNNYHWIFVHYDDVISGEAIPVLEAFSGVKLDTSEVNQSISRSTDWAPKLSWLTHRCMRLYSRLVERARSDKIKWGTLPQD
jgi:hypothetical protein